MMTTHSRVNNCCRTRHLWFNDSHLHVQHMNPVHSLPLFSEEFLPRETPLESALIGFLRKFGTANRDEAGDNERFMLAQKP